jgi:transposase
MAKQQRTFTTDFKLEAVRLVKTSGKGLTQTARDLGIADSTLSHWCQQLSEKGPEAFPGSGHQTTLEEENRRLRRELEQVRQERDILKKTVAIFTRGPL